MIEFKSVEQQDQWVLHRLNSKQSGYFVDIGAADGIRYSNTYVLEKEYNWTGICVEANHLLRGFPSLKKNRSCICEHAYIFNEEKEMEFITRGRSSQYSGLIHEAATHEVLRKKESNHPVTRVTTTTIQSILDKHKAPKHIDYLSIDTEGAELQAVQSIDLNKHMFSLITIEHNYHEMMGNREVDLIKRCKIQDILLSNGYLMEETQTFPHEFDDWFIHKSLLQ